jgi:hypothetical protein
MYTSSSNHNVSETGGINRKIGPFYPLPSPTPWVGAENKGLTLILLTSRPPPPITRVGSTR